tara:strand:+ start:36 stop:611 length:576 start_codon:yes stop_codon:yes gene_type:complete
MIVDQKNKFIFVAVAKTASTSIRIRFGADCGVPPNIYHMFLEDIIKSHPGSEHFYKFAFVRNPYDRLVSAYYDFRFDKGHQEWAFPIYKYDTFKDFIMNLETSPCRDFIHLQPQYDFLQVDGEVKLDFVGRYENLREDFKKVEKDLGIRSVELPTIRTSTHPDFKELYDKEMKEIVKRMYGNDFEEFGYEF